VLGAGARSELTLLRFRVPCSRFFPDTPTPSLSRQRRDYSDTVLSPLPHRSPMLDIFIPCRYIFYTMEFDFDPRKSAANKAKHGIDFSEAQALWVDPDLLEIPARTSDEPRFLVIGKIGGRHWSGVITYRGDAVRIISIRRSRPEEVDLYENES